MNEERKKFHPVKRGEDSKRRSEDWIFFETFRDKILSLLRVYVCVDCTYVLVYVWREGGFLITVQHFCTSHALNTCYRAVSYPINTTSAKQSSQWLRGFLCYLSHVISALDSRSFILMSSTSTGYLFGGDEQITNESSLEFLRDWLLQ